MLEQFDLEVSAVDGMFATGSGQNAWKRECLPSVMADLARQRYAILCGEVWVVEGSLFSALSPRKQGGWAVFSWEVPRRLLGEPWDHFVARSSRDTLAAIHELNAEAQVVPEVSDRLYYYLRYADEVSYHKLTTLHPRERHTRLTVRRRKIM